MFEWIGGFVGSGGGQWTGWFVMYQDTGCFGCFD